MGERCVRAQIDENGALWLEFESDKSGVEYLSVERAREDAAQRYDYQAVLLTRLAILRDLVNTEPPLRDLEAIVQRVYDVQITVEPWMALYPNLFMVPFNHLMMSASAGSIGTVSLDTSDDYIAWCFHADTPDPITRVYAAVNAITGASPNYRFSLQSVGTDGMPTGTILSSGNAYATGTVTSGANERTLTASYTPSSFGELIALVVDYNTGTINTSNFAAFRTQYGGESATGGMPYFASRINGAAYTKTGGNEAAFYGYGTASRWFGRPYLSTGTVQSVTNGHRAAVKFSLPAALVSSYRVAGWWLHSRRVVSTTAEFKWAIWDTSGTALVGPFTFDPDQSGRTAQWNAFTRHLFPTNSLPLLEADETYYIGHESVGGSAAGTLDVLTHSSNDHLSIHPLGVGVHCASWNGSVWADSNLSLPMAALLVSEWTTGGATGSESAMPFMWGV